MSDVNANIGIVFDTKDALASLRQLQAGLSKFNQSLTAGNVNAANAQKGLNAQLVQAINSTGKFVASQKNVLNSTNSFTNALEKNKLSMREYFRYTGAAATANTKILGRAFTAERDIINRARKDRVKALQTQYIQLTNSQGDLVKVLQVVPKHLDAVNGKYTDYATRVQMAAQRQQLMNQLLKQGSTQLLNFGKNTQWAGRQLMVGLTVPLSMLGGFAAQTFREMEKEVVNFKRVYGEMFTDNGSTDKAVADIQRLGIEFTKYGIAVKDTMAMAAKAAAMGLTGSDLNAQVTAATRLAVLGQVEQQQALETTISLQNAFGISADQLAQKINFLNAVENQTVLSIEDLTIAVPKAGPVVKQLGGSVEDLAFFMTAMKEGGINASEGANALKSGLASLINPSTKASKFLGELGINIKGIVEANSGNLKGTVVGFAQALDTLDPLNRARAIEQLFGKFQFARLSTLFQNVTKDTSQASRALGLAGASIEELAILSERELGRVEDAVGVKFQKTIEQLKVQLIPVGKAFLEALTPVVAFFGNILEKFNNFSDGTKKAIAIVIGVVGGLAPIALMTFGLLANGLANLIKFFALLRGGMAKLNGQNAVLGGGFDYLTQQEIENLAQSNALHTSHQQLIQTFNVEVGSVNALATAYANAGSQARALAASSPGLFNVAPGAKGATSKLPKKFSRGGVVPGTGSQDSVPSMLTPGEVVLTKGTVKANPELVAALMNGNIKKYGKGTGIEGNWASQIASRTASSGTNPASIEASLTQDLAKVLKRATDKGIDTSQIEQRYKELVTNATQSLDELNTHTKASFQKMRDEALKPLLKGSGLTARYQQENSQYSHLGMSNTMPLSQVQSRTGVTRPDVLEELNTVNAAYAANGMQSPTARVMGGAAINLTGSTNRVMAEGTKSGQANFVKQNGPVIDAFTKDFEKMGVEKWKATTDGLGITFDKVQGEFEQYDAQVLKKVKAWKKANPNGLFNDEVFAGIEQKSRAQASSTIQAIMKSADNMMTGIRVSMTDAEAKMVAKYATDNGLPIPRVTQGKTGNRKILNAEKRTRGTAFGRVQAIKAGEETGDAIVDGLRSRSGTDAKSPSRKGKAAGKEVSDGVVQGMKESEAAVKAQGKKTGSAATDAVKKQVQSDTVSGGRVVDAYGPTFYPDGKVVSDAEGNPLPPRQAKKLVTKYNRGVRREKVGQYSGKVAGAAGTASMIAGMAGAPMAVTGALGAGSMVASMAPALAGMGPVGIAITAIAAVGASLYLLDKHFNDAAKKQAEYVRSISATTEKMKKIGEFTGKVGASELMAKRREGGQFQTYNESARKGSDFGQKFLTNETGKAIQAAFSSNMVKKGSRKAAEDLAFELSNYISDGVMTAEEAKSVAYQIGVNLADASLTTNIEGNLRMLVGPNGENLLKDPLQARMRIVTMADSRSQRTVQEMFSAQASGNSGRTEAAQLASYSNSAIQIAQSQADAISVYAEKQKKILESELLATTNKQRQVEIQKQLNGLIDMQITANAKIAVQVANAVANFKTADKAGRQGTFFDASKADVKAKYEGTSFAPAAQRVLNITARADTDSSFKKGNNNNQVAMAKGQAFEAQVQFIMASGVMNPAQIEAMLKIFEGDLNSMDIALNVGIRKLGGARLGELELLLGGTDKETAKKITLALVRKDPAEFDKTAKALALLAASDGYEVNMSAYLKTVGIAGLEKLTNKLTAIENIKDPITKVLDLQSTGLTVDQLAQLTTDWAYYMSLDPVTRKEAIQTYTMITDAIMNFDSPEARAEWARKYASQEALMAGDVGSKEYTTTYNEIYKVSVTGDTELLASMLTQKKYGTPSAIDVKAGPPPAVVPTGKKDNPLAFLDSLAMRLKQVRDGAFNAMKPVDSLLAAFTSKKAQANASRMFDKFSGIQNKLMKMGVTKDFRDAINSMSAEDFDKIANLKGKNALFNFEKGKPKTKATITSMTKTGKAANAGYSEANLGDFNLVNQETIKSINDQDIAYKKLIASGMSASNALQVVAVEGQAAAIAAGAIKTSDPDWKTYVANIKSANDALEKQALLNKLIKANEEFKIYQKMPELVTKMKDMGYSMDQIDAVLGDPELAKQLAKDLEDGKVDAKEIAEYINSIEAKKIIEIEIAINKGDWQKVASEGRSLVDEMFRVKEALIRTGSQGQQLERNKGQIADLEAQLLPFRREIQLINDEISKAQREIEISYSRPIEDLTEQVNDLNRELEMNPFFGDRAIKKIQDENNMLSNDLTVIAHAADEVNKKYDAQAEALSKVEEINSNIMEQQKQQLGLADALTQGDISAAAQAAQGMRQTSAQQFASGQSDALDQARKNALGSLTGPQSGLTQDQITEKQYQNSQKIYAMETDPRRLEILNQIQIKQDEIYNLEEKREQALLKIRDLEDKIYKIEQDSIKPIQDRIDKLTYENALLEAEIEKQVRSLTVMEKTRLEWENIYAQIDASALVSKDLQKAFNDLLTAAAAVNAEWQSILAAMAAAAAMGTPGGGGSYVAPADTPESIAAFEEFIGVVEELDSAQAALDDAYDKGLWAQFDALQRRLAAAQAAYDATLPALDPNMSGGSSGGMDNQYAAKGGLIKPRYFAVGGNVRGTDSVPAMLTPGEFVMSKYAVQAHGTDKMKAINNGNSVGDAVYNYSISVNVKSDANPDEIARAVMGQVRSTESQRLRGTRI